MHGIRGLQAVDPPRSPAKNCFSVLSSGNIGLVISPVHRPCRRIQLEAVLVASRWSALRLQAAATVFFEIDPRTRFAGAGEGPPPPVERPLAFVSVLLGDSAVERTPSIFSTACRASSPSTRDFVQRVAGTGAEIVDTRKTLPGGRARQVRGRRGGGTQPSSGLRRPLVKDNRHRGGGRGRCAVKVAGWAPSRTSGRRWRSSPRWRRKGRLAGGATPAPRQIAPRTNSHGPGRASSERGLTLEASQASTWDGTPVAETGVHRIDRGPTISPPRPSLVAGLP